ncbi:MAG: DNA-directed RNA polymerase subunit K [Candidatus Aenigmarchaeota archaeon]|nr:DNA-directed RNA polymerase subunit K [Candidatus Aenigmarchaeota archaeon]
MIWPTDRLTRFEVARLLGARSLQISLGAPILIKSSEAEASKIAKVEFKENLLPITIKRKLPSGETSVVESKKAIDMWVREHPGEF